MISQTDLLPPQPATTRGASTHISYDAAHNRIAYAAGKSVFVRSLDTDARSAPVQFTKHTATATVAAFSPSGNYIASGDESGHVVVWDASVAGKENTFVQPAIKSEFDVLGGPVRAIAWDADNARIIAVGSGKEKFGHCFTWDSGNSIGEIQGHAETINAVDIRPQRPYRAATVGDDKAMVFFQGPPFKFDRSSREHHTNAARGVRFSPDGRWLVSVGADRTIVVYDGKSGEYIEKLENAHAGGISGVAWFPDSASFVTASADNCVKRWSPAGIAEQQVYAAAQTASVARQQVGVVVTKAHVLSLSLNGEINLFSHDGAAVAVVAGHQKPLTQVAVVGQTLLSGASDGTVFQRAVSGATVSSEVSRFSACEAHSNYVSSIRSIGEYVVTTGWDDTLKVWKDGALARSVALEGQAKAVAIAKNIVVLLEHKIQVFDTGLSLLAEEPLEFVASYVDAVPGSGTVFVTNESDRRLEVYEAAASAIKHVHSYPALRAAPNLAKVSPDGAYVAVAEITGKYTLYSTQDQSAVTTRWAFHSSRVNGAEWTADSKFLVSGGLDCAVYIYSVARPSKVLKTQLTHQTGVSDLAWLEYADAKGSFASVGLDGVTKTWDVDFSAY